MEKCKLAVIIVNWNTKELLDKCLNVLCVNIPKTIIYEIIVVDNGSIDGSISVLEGRPNVKVILSKDNLGFAVANNRALRIANSEYVLFLNTDVILTEGAIGKLLEFMDNHPNAGLCTPSLIREDSSLQETHITFPTLTTELSGRAGFKRKDEPCRVESVRGACMLARRDVIKNLGGFNEKYFLFLEETELCLRLYKKGYEVWYVPTVKVIHTGGGSAEKEKLGARIEYWRSRYIFFKENYSQWDYILLNLGLSIKLVFDWILNLIIFNKKLKIYSKIILWHVLGKPGDWGINSGNIIKSGDWLVRREFQSWLDKNKNLINPPTFPRSIRLCGKDLETPFIPAARPRGIQEGGGINSIGDIKLLKENSNRKLLLYDNEVFIKIYKRDSIFSKPWAKEWRLINRLRQLDIPTVMPIACGSGCLITKKLDNVRTLHEFILEGGFRFKEKLVLIKALAEFIRKLHIKGIYHGDLHAGNILIEKNNNGCRFYITDLHRAKIKLFLSKKDIINNLVQLDKFFSVEISKTDRLRFFKHYISGTQWEKNYRILVKNISGKTETACHKLWQKRDRLYLVKDKYGIRDKCHGVRYMLNPKYKNIDVAGIINYARTGYGDIIKDSRSSYLSRFNMPEIGSAVLKIYRQKRFINYLKDYFRKSRGFKAWRGSWALITRVIQTPEPILAGEARRFGILKSSFIITKDMPDAKNLTLFVKDTPSIFKKEAAGKLSTYIKRIHERGILPLDMKGSNILVQKENDSLNLYLVDLDHIKIGRRISLNDRFYNIKQIKKSTGLSCHTSLPIKRILIIKPSSLGDIIQALPVAALLRDNFPSANIWWLANRRYIDLLKLVPYIDRTIVFERDRWSKWENIFSTIFEFTGFIRNIRNAHFDIVLDLQGLFRSGLITGFSGAPLRAGFGGARECASLFYNNRVYQKLDKLNARERYLFIAKYISEPQGLYLKLNIPNGLKKWAEDIWGSDRDVRIAVNPGGRWHTKRWPSIRYAELIDSLNKRYNAKVLLIGDENDSAVTSSIITKINSSAMDLAGRIKLAELAAVLNSCCVLITNDSGPMHLADYLGKPIIAIFGPTDPSRTGPAGQKAKIIKSKISCSPCFKKYCKNLKCMEDVSVEEVLNIVSDVLQK